MKSFTVRPVGSGELMARLMAVSLARSTMPAMTAPLTRSPAVQVLVAAAAERDLEEAIVFALAELRVDDLGDDRVDDGLAVVAVLLEERGIERQVLVDVDAVDFLRALLGGTRDLDFAVDAAGAQDGGIDHVRAVGGEDDDHLLERLDAVHLGAEHGHERVEDAAGAAGGGCRGSIRTRR